MNEHAERVTTTLNLLRKAGACEPRYAHLVRALGGVSFDHDAPINLLTILELNGADDCLWALSATAENCDKVARLMAADFAESVLHLYETQYSDDDRPRKAIQAARDLALGHITAAAAYAAANAADYAAAYAASDAAYDASYAASYDASADAAAYAAAYAAARGAARGAARAAAYAAAYSAYDDFKERVLREYLLP